MSASFWWQIFSKLLLSCAPGRPVAPAFQGFGSPRSGLVRVTQIAGIRNLHRITLRLWSVNIQSVTGGREEVFVMQSTKDGVRTDGV